MLCLGPTPAVQRVMVFSRLTLDAVNRTAAVQEAAAGKSVNVAKVLKALGETPVALGFAGGPRGAWLVAELSRLGIEHDLVSVSPETRQCLTVVDETAATHTELVEESRPVGPGDYDRLAHRLRARLGRARAVVVSGSLTPGGPVDFYRRCVHEAHAAGVLSVVDAAGPPLAEALPAVPDVVKPNRSELASTVGRALQDEAAVMVAMAEVHERGARQVVVTAGRRPTFAYDGRQFWRITPPPISPQNPIGAGDAFAAGLAWRLMRGDGLGEACRWAGAVAAADALTLLPGEVDAAQLDGLLARTSLERL